MPSGAGLGSAPDARAGRDIAMARGHRPSGQSAQSQRQLRVGELVRHALSEILMRGDVQDPALAGVVVTVPEVRMSPDLRVATAYVAPLGGQKGEALVEALTRHARFLRGEVAHRVTLKFAPELRFRLDDRFERASRLDALLRSEPVRRDLGRHGERDGEGEP